MKKIFLIIILQSAFVLFSAFEQMEEESCSLTIKVKDLRNSTGVVQFALYNDADGFPDLDYNSYYRISAVKIVNGVSEFTFENLPLGKYAVKVLHDEDSNGKIKKGIFLPKEGIGFSNLTELSIRRKPSFFNTGFDLSSNKTMYIKMVYL